MGRRRGMRPGEGRYDEHFWSKVDRNGPVVVPDLGPCWQWTKSKCRAGYGTVRCNNRVDGAHRVAFWIHNGREPSQWVLHACDNPGCCNPHHLREGDRAANMADMIGKGRHRGAKWGNHNSQRYPERRPRGERQWCAKLTVEKVREIRASSEVAEHIAPKYGLNPTTVRKIRQRRTWKHVA